MKPLLISFSGGRTSAYMTKLIMDKQIKLLNDFKPFVVFANTGCEHPKTLEFVQKCDEVFNWGG